MESGTPLVDSDTIYPVLLIPRKCTTLETNCDASDNVFIDLNITSPDIEGNEMCLYSGFCNVKLIDNYDVSIHHVSSPDNSGSSSCIDIEQPPLIISEQGTGFPYNQSKVWIDPVRSPHVYNHYDTTETQEYSVCRKSHTSHITVEQHSTYITQNVFNYKESIQYSPTEDFEHKKFRKPHASETVTQQPSTNQDGNNLNLYEDNEFECGVFLSQLSEEIMNEKENKAKDERKYIGLQSENGALKQLMSSDIQSASKQRKTILFLGHDSHCGQTIQKIAVNDPSLECSKVGNLNPANIKTDDVKVNRNQKKYQCDKCKQIFDQIAAFKQHMVGNHNIAKSLSMYDIENGTVSEVKFMCTECGKTLKSQEKFEIHCMGHGDPDLECNKCHKVFASKFTLRTHRKLHYRKYPCNFCYKTFSEVEDLKAHVAKIHFIFLCIHCNFTTKNYIELTEHEQLHSGQIVPNDSSETDRNDSFVNDICNDTGNIVQPLEIENLKLENQLTASSKNFDEEIKKADSVIAKVISNKIFLLHSKKVRKHRRYNKSCDVCFKMFDRIGDLKRHLIEHVIRSTLAKTPVNKNGTLNIQCEVCQVETFTKIDRYKAHLREHAKLTLYKCTFCDKSFSDSSNFSKHKKIHGTTYLQCDLCQRKFNSKKMITQHMEYHNKHSPVQCQYCDKIFHFESMLNKHVKCAHSKEVCSRFKCRFCFQYFKTLKEKWDHEWTIHNVRKMIVDCLICDSKFRKYSELKRHCIITHDMDIPPAKKLLKKKRNKNQCWK